MAQEQKRYWLIRGYDSLVLIYEKRIEVGQITDEQLKALLKALTAKAGLTFDEIVGAYAKRRTKIANHHLEVRRIGLAPGFMCGSNPHFVASIENFRRAGSDSEVRESVDLGVLECGGEKILEMKFGVVQFPGANCDDDAYHAIKAVIGKPVEFIWHQSEQVSGFDAIILPGGFSYGDYLRTGAIARFSPIMGAISEFARSGGLVLGVCNGFQILLEAGLLPGAMTRNQRLRFLCRPVHVRVESTDTPFTCEARAGQVLEMPIAHMEGNYFCDSETLAELERNRQVIFRYVTAEGRDAAANDFEANPNGSLHAIAGICNRERNVLGLMPHPERAVEQPLGSEDGSVIFRSLVASLTRQASISA